MSKLGGMYTIVMKLFSILGSFFNEYMFSFKAIRQLYLLKSFSKVKNSKRTSIQAVKLKIYDAFCVCKSKGSKVYDKGIKKFQNDFDFIRIVQIHQKLLAIIKTLVSEDKDLLDTARETYLNSIMIYSDEDDRPKTTQNFETFIETDYRELILQEEVKDESLQQFINNNNTI